MPSLFLLLLLNILVGCSPGSAWQTVEVHGNTMGTTYSIKIVTQQPEIPATEDVKAWAEQVFQEVNQSMSTYIDDSELSLLNRSKSADWHSLSPELAEVLALSHHISQKSGGAFDITVMPLVNLWGFGPEKRSQPPSDAEIAQGLAQIGYDKIVLDADHQRIRKPPDVHMDLSAIAKGYAADKMGQALARRGFDHVMVEVGGELVLRGHNQKLKPWRIGIETPSYDLLRAAVGPAGAVDISGKGMATSGDYRNYYEVDGVRVSHTINPKTGHPIRHNLASVTVIAATCAEADGWATALNVLGPEQALQTAEREGLAVYLLVRDGDGFTGIMSTALQTYWVKN